VQTANFSVTLRFLLARNAAVSSKPVTCQSVLQRLVKLERMTSDASQHLLRLTAL